MEVRSLDEHNNPCAFVSMLVIAHGEELREQPTPLALNDKVHKLTLSGLSGNITSGSSVLDALFFNEARIQAHDRSISHVEKLRRVREGLFCYPHIGDEIKKQQTTQEEFVTESLAAGRYQRVVDAAGWIPEPTKVEYNRRYSFNANPWSSGRHKHIDESRGFGIWLVDASIGIANNLGLKPGIHPNVVSLMPMLGLVQTSARASPIYAPDSTGSDTTFFDLVDTIQRRFGENTYVSVIDLSCRYYNWDKKNPGARETHAALEVSRGKVDRFLTPVLPTQWSERIHRYLTNWSDEVPSAAAGPVPRIIDYVLTRQSSQPVAEVVGYWERNGAMKYHGSTQPFESDVKYTINGGNYGLGDTLQINGRALNIFYILEGGACFFCHENVDGTKRTSYLTPVTDGRKLLGFEITDNLSEKLKVKEPTPVKQFNMKTLGGTDPSPRSPETPPPFLPPYGYLSLRMGGRRMRQRTRARITKHKKYKRRHARNRKKTKRSNKYVNPHQSNPK
jgi:hypothetical protein